jgi:hypothetical protein
MSSRKVDPRKLRTLIAERGWTIKTFREQAGLTPTLVAYVLARPPRRNFSLLSATKAAKALGCSIDDFSTEIERDEP